MLKRVSSLFAVCLATLLAHADGQTLPNAPSKLFLGKDTTLITGPLNADGTPNYVQALNDILSKDVTAENNAAVALFHVFGPDFISSVKARPFVSKALRVEFPAGGHYFVDLTRFARQQHDALPEAEAEKPLDFDSLEKAQDAAVKGPWKAEQHPMVAAWLKFNDASLDALAAASKRPRFYIPLVSVRQPPSMMEATINVESTRLRMGANALAARAMFRTGNNDVSGAREDLLAIHRMARLQMQIPTMLSALIAVAIDNVAFRGEEALLRSPELLGDESKMLLADLQRLPEIKISDSELFLGERFSLLDTLMPALRGNPNQVLAWYIALWGPPFSLPATPGTVKTTLDRADWAVTLRVVNRRQDLIDAALKIPLATQRHAALESIRERDKSLKIPAFPWEDASEVANNAATEAAPESREARRQRYLKVISAFHSQHAGESIEAFSKRIAAFFTPADPTSEKFCILMDRGTAVQRLTLIAAALAVYHADHNTFPPTLEALHAPAYLPGKELPLDPFTGKSFNYHPTSADGYVLYSNGDNGQDDGGRDKAATPKGDDIVMRVP